MYGDDLIITGNHDDHIAQVKKELHAGFKMTDLGLLHYYLGVSLPTSTSYFHFSE